jgi:hypothetical protein
MGEPATSHTMSDAPASPLAERDVIIARAEPVQGPMSHNPVLRFDPVTGLFFLLPP